MNRRIYRLTEAADQDVSDILAFTGVTFGPRQRDTYARLIQQAIDLIVAEPERPGSRGRGELAKTLRSFRVSLAGSREGSASHTLYYLPASFEDERDGVIIVRILPEAMEPGHHIEVRNDEIP